MNPHQLRLFATGCTLLFCTALVILSLASVEAGPPIADFQPTLTPHEAALRVSAAQDALHQQRSTSSNLPLLSSVYFAETGHHLSNRNGFLSFWEANGRIEVLGYPITEEIVEGDRIVQYFERARLELHPEYAGTLWQIQLGRLVVEQLPWMWHAPVADPQLPGVVYIPETGHTLTGVFLNYWATRGGARIFGFPITEQLLENGRPVQYFERVRMEYFAEYAGTSYEIMLTDLGRQLAWQRGLPTAPVAQYEVAPQWAPPLPVRWIEVSIGQQWLYAYEDDVLVYSAPVTTGKDGYNTPIGNFAIYDKLPLQTMSGSAGGESWYVPDVPWVMYIYGGVALHGTYWHNLFGSGYRISHGCINLTIADAQWLYNWAAIGVPVSVRY